MSEPGRVTIVQPFKDVPMPMELLCDPQLSAQAKVVYGVLLWHGVTPDRCYPGHARIGEWAGISERSVARPLRELEQAGWIERVRRPGGGGHRSSDGYTLKLTLVGWEPSNVPNAQSSAAQARVSARAKRAQTRDEQSKGERLQEEQPHDGTASPPPSDEADGTLFGASSKPARSAEDARADETARAIWERLDPKPTTKHAFTNLRRTVKRMLAGGDWTPEDLVLDAPAAWSLSESAITAARKKRAEQAKPVVRRNGSTTSDGQAFDSRIRSFAADKLGMTPPTPKRSRFEDSLDVKETTR